MDPNIKTFLIQLLEDAGQTELPSEVQEQLLQDLNQRLEQRLVLVAMGAMSEDAQIKLQKLVEDQASDEVKSEFIHQNVNNADQVFKKAFEDFRDLYLEK